MPASSRPARQVFLAPGKILFCTQDCLIINSHSLIAGTQFAIERKEKERKGERGNRGKPSGKKTAERTKKAARRPSLCCVSLRLKGGIRDTCYM